MTVVRFEFIFFNTCFAPKIFLPLFVPCPLLVPPLFGSTSIGVGFPYMGASNLILLSALPPPYPNCGLSFLLP